MVYFAVFNLDNVKTARRIGEFIFLQIFRRHHIIFIPLFQSYRFGRRTEIIVYACFYFNKNYRVAVFGYYVYFTYTCFKISFCNFIAFIAQELRRFVFACAPQKFFIKVFLCNLQGPISLIFSICAFVPYPLCFSNPYCGNSFAYSSISSSL